MAEVTGQRIVNFVESTSPNNQDYFATDNASNGNRKVSYVTLSDKVLDKLSTKTFSLDGSNKTVLDALAELFQADDTLNARIDNIITPSGQASLSELIDVRTNFLGVTYGSAGEAVRNSDLLASGFETNNHSGDEIYGYPDTEDASNNEYMTYTFDVSKYKGGRVFFYFFDDTDTPGGSTEPSLEIYNWMFMSDAIATAQNIATGATKIWNNTDIKQYFQDHGYVAIVKGYFPPTVDTSCYRKVMILSIPEDFPNKYIWFACPSEVHLNKRIRQDV